MRRNVADGGVEIVTDSKTCADSYSTGRDHCSQSVDADLWCEAWRHVGRLGGVIIRWVKAHAGRQHLAAGLLTFHDLCGNYCVDALANRAADVAQAFPEDAANYLRLVGLDTVIFHNFKSQIFKLSVSNPKSKYNVYVSVLSQT